MRHRVAHRKLGRVTDHRIALLRNQATALMQALLAQPANPLGLHAFVTDFSQKAENLTQALTDGRLRAVQGVARAVD